MGCVGEEEVVKKVMKMLKFMMNRIVKCLTDALLVPFQDWWRGGDERRR